MGPTSIDRANDLVYSSTESPFIISLFAVANIFLVFIRVKLPRGLGREQSRVSLLVGLGLLELGIGAVEPVPEAQPPVAGVKPETIGLA